MCVRWRRWGVFMGKNKLYFLTTSCFFDHTWDTKMYRSKDYKVREIQSDTLDKRQRVGGLGQERQIATPTHLWVLWLKRHSKNKTLTIACDVCMFVHTHTQEREEKQREDESPYPKVILSCAEPFFHYNKSLSLPADSTLLFAVLADWQVDVCEITRS